jgi:hypothetical protein
MSNLLALIKRLAAVPMFSVLLIAALYITGCSEKENAVAPSTTGQPASVSKAVTASSTASAAPAAPTKEAYFICPSVSTHNPNGMWVIGAHGGYYVNIPVKGGINGPSRVYLTLPVQVANTAQIPAGWALYKDLASYPNFVGMAGLLSEGIGAWLGSPAGWTEGDGAVVMDNGDGTYNVTDVRLGRTITLDHSIPLASAAVW